MGRRPIDRRPNERLAYWLSRSGLSNRQLAMKVVELAVRRDVKGVHPDESRARRWLSGENPREPVPGLIAEILAELTGLPLTREDLGLLAHQRTLPPDPSELPWRSGSTIDAIVHLSQSEIMLPHTRHSSDAAHVHSGEALLAPLYQWGAAIPSELIERPARHTPAGRVGAKEVVGTRAVTEMFREADNRHGGALSRRAVIAQLADATAMLDSCSYTEATGRELFSAVADLGSVAGWMSFDAGMHQSAQKLFITSLHAASEGADKAVGVHILQCMARQMSHLGYYTDALELVALAQYGGRRHVSSATKSMLASLESRFNAILGHLDESERAAGQAEEFFTSINPDEEPPHMAFFDMAELSATLGVVHQIAARKSQGSHRTRRADKSLDLLGGALSLRPEHRTRSKAFDHLALARTHLVASEIGGACQETSMALTLFGKIGSKRVADRLTELHDEAAQFSQAAEAMDLRNQIRTTVASTARGILAT